MESVPVPPIALKAVELNVHRMAQLGGRDGGPCLHDLGHSLIACEFPSDVDHLSRHPTAGFEWCGRQPSPQDEPVRIGVAGCDTEDKRVGCERRSGHNPTVRTLRDPRHAR